MVSSYQTIKINAPGGLISTGTLQDICLAAFESGLQNLHLGHRQQIFLYVGRYKSEILLDKLETLNVLFEKDHLDKFPNIVSSYAAENIFNTDHWLSEGIYRDILEEFHHKPLIKINMTNPEQGLVPLFTGQLNFIASPIQNFWYVYLQAQQGKSPQRWKKLIYSTDIANLCLQAEKYIDLGSEEIFEQFNQINGLNIRSVEEELTQNRQRFPYYEGLQKSGESYWLGIYRRNNDFSIPFLQDLCQLCNQQRIGQLCISPWNSIMVKGIAESDRIYWEKLLGDYGINIRHSSLELNWQLPDLDKDALKLKKNLVSSFDTNDVRTYGLSFTIKTQPKQSTWTPIVIEEKPFFTDKIFKALRLYKVYISNDFTINSTSYTLFEDNVLAKNLDYVLLKVCKLYYAKLGALVGKLQFSTESETNVKQVKFVYRCTCCYTIEMPSVSMGTKTDSIKMDSMIPSDIICSLCGSGPSSFEIANEQLLLNQSS